MVFEEHDRFSVETLNVIIKRGTKPADDMIYIHQRLIAKADELLALYPIVDGYLKQKVDSQRALLHDYDIKRFLEEMIAKARDQQSRSPQETV